MKDCGYIGDPAAGKRTGSIANALSSPKSALLAVVAPLAFITRLWAVKWSNLPTGDEINVYINNAQRFVANGVFPPLSEHPGVSLIYSCFIGIARILSLSVLPGVFASQAFNVIAGVGSVILMFLAVSRTMGKTAAFWVSLMHSVFPGNYFAMRGDVAAYHLLLSAVLLGVSYVGRRGIWLGIIIGALCTSLYLCRSDGIYLTALISAVGCVLRPRNWRTYSVVLVCFIMGVIGFKVAYRTLEGDWGAGTRDRAFVAFYQAEGLLDKKGGSWQDYTERGIEKFGPPEKHGHSFIRFILSNPADILRRASKNIRTLGHYIGSASGVHLLLPLLVMLLVLQNSASRRAALRYSAPCVMTSMIYLAFYYQKSYFTMLSHGLSTLLGLGIFSGLNLFPERLKRSVAARAAVIIMAVSFSFAWGSRSLSMFPGSRGVPTTELYKDAILYLKEHAVGEGRQFFAYDYRGSRAMYIYADTIGPALHQSQVEATHGQATLELFRAEGISHVLVDKWHGDLWRISGAGIKVVFENDTSDVRVLRVAM